MGGREIGEEGGEKKKRDMWKPSENGSLVGSLPACMLPLPHLPHSLGYAPPSTQTLHFRVTSIQMASRSDFLKSVQPQSALVDVTTLCSPSTMFFRPKELRSDLSTTRGHPLRSENRCPMDSLNHAWLSYAHGSQWLILGRDPRIQL